MSHSLQQNDEIVIESDDFEDISDVQATVDDELNSIFSEFGGADNDVELKINVYRIMSGKGELEYCFSALPNELPIMDKIRDEYGAGAYEIRVYKNKKIFKRKKLNMAARVNPPVKRDNGQTDMAAIIREIAEQQQRNNQMLIEAIRNNTPAMPTNQGPGNMLEMMTGIATMMKTMQDLAPKQESNTDLLLRGMEIMKDINGSDRESNVWDAVKSTLPAITELSKSIPAMQPAPYGPMNPQSNPAQRPGQQTAPGPQDNTHQNGNDTEMHKIFMKQYLKNLVNQAARNADVDLYADLILDQVPEEQIREFLMQPDSMNQLIQLEPSVQQYQPWFEGVITSIKHALTNDGPEGNTLDHETEQPEPDKPANHT